MTKELIPISSHSPLTPRGVGTFAGIVQIRKARNMTLPSNFRVLQLPHLAWAEAYPTLGPTGLIDANINGLASSIELYLGKSALTDRSGGSGANRPRSGMMTECNRSFPSKHCSRDDISTGRSSSFVSAGTRVSN